MMETTNDKWQKPTFRELQERLANAPDVFEAPNPFSTGQRVARPLAERLRRVDPTLIRRYRQKSGE